MNIHGNYRSTVLFFLLSRYSASIANRSHQMFVQLDVEFQILVDETHGKYWHFVVVDTYSGLEKCLNAYCRKFVC